MTAIDYYSLCTIPIVQTANGKSFGEATSFIWQRGSQHYLITNWHVVTGRNAETNDLETPVQPDMLKAMFNPRMKEFGKLRRCQDYSAVIGPSVPNKNRDFGRYLRNRLNGPGRCIGADERIYLTH
jgi:hypothetical protein